ncbi:MAG: hypothetical protein A3F84_06440 [Candidatus Handelsmanbacteria bacterium RIFCSPLOWO2_12_FULL_64_10]|uniref:Secretin/TonB short N-terminal domain-containing protein n=1 Tax=Handelsmanbacteria sp. (strain RIFCSPLOWO2_12_FULL_64_10) TaxID=1817868 RepID=A0A1F6CR43_HANXR|nr:MAG: hypothetical protein A3F84_06440 [Candidatus Handelsmanbacteria bacterium RIFCSPLOWO2_12_FULL_64_10]
MGLCLLVLTGWGGMADAATPRITLQLQGADVVEALKVLAEKGGLNIVIGPNVQGRVNMFVENVSVGEALDVIVESGGLAYTEERGILQVMTAKDYEQRYGRIFRGRVETFRVSHAQANALQQALLQLKSEGGKLSVDGRTNSLVVMDHPEVIAQMEAVLQRLDVPSVMRVVPLKHIAVSVMASVVQKMLSPGGKMEADPAQNQIIIWDIESNVDHVVDLIQKYDQTPFVETRVFALNYASAEEVSAQVQKELTQGVGVVRADPKTHSLIVTDLPDRLALISRIVGALDAQRKQVLIEAKIVQVALKDQYKLGVDWEYITKKANGLQVTSHLLTLAQGDKGARVTSGVLARDNYTALMEMLQEVGKTNVLSTPRVTVVDGTEAKILVGSTVPYKTVDSREDNGVLNRFERVTLVEVGVKLYVTPRIAQDGFIQMRIHPEVSSVLTFSEGIPVVETSQADTEVRVKEGATIIIAGLIKDDVKQTVKGVPLVSRIPLLGKLVSSTDVSKEKTELAIFLTPRIVSGEGEMTQRDIEQPGEAPGDKPDIRERQK